MNPTIEITGIRIRRAMVPVKRVLNTRVGRFTKGPFLLIDLELKGGGAGRVLGFTFMAVGLRWCRSCWRNWPPRSRAARSPYADMPAVHDACQKALTHMGHEGVAQMALSMLDMALHDALAREAGVPLYKLLGGSNAPLPDLSQLRPRHRRAAGRRPRSQGHAGRARRLHAHEAAHGARQCGRRDRRLQGGAQRHRPGRADLLRFQPGLPSASALETCRAIDGLGLTWIEEPVAYDDYDTQARLATKLGTPISVGENWWSWRVGKAAIEMGACDYVMPDLLRIGGVTGWMRLARVAEARAVPFSSHLSPDYSAHVLAATPTKHWLEFMDWGQDLMHDPLVPVKGFTTPRDTPGTGLEWNEKAIAPHLVDG